MGTCVMSSVMGARGCVMHQRPWTTQAMPRARREAASATRPTDSTTLQESAAPRGAVSVMAAVWPAMQETTGASHAASSVPRNDARGLSGGVGTQTDTASTFRRVGSPRAADRPELIALEIAQPDGDAIRAHRLDDIDRPPRSVQHLDDGPAVTHRGRALVDPPAIVTLRRMPKPRDFHQRVLR